MDLLVVVAESSPELVVQAGDAPVVPRDAGKGHCFIGIAGTTPGISSLQQKTSTDIRLMFFLWGSAFGGC